MSFLKELCKRITQTVSKLQTRREINHDARTDVCFESDGICVEYKTISCHAQEVKLVVYIELHRHYKVPSRIFTQQTHGYKSLSSMT